MHTPRLNLQEETRYEKLPLTVYDNQAEASMAIAARIAALVRRKNKEKQKAVLGLATGISPLKIYKELIRLHREEGLSFKAVVTFNLDEYYPMNPVAAQSYMRFMKENLFNHIDIDLANVHVPDGTLPEEAVSDFCIGYEEKISACGGIDLQLLGIGRTGHIGFNEPDSAPNSGTRLVTLDELTRNDASRDFGGKENVPVKAITMGIGTIFKAREIILMGWNKKKAAIIKKAVEGDISGSVPATYLQLSTSVEFVVDKYAASELTRYDTPWLVKDCVWDESLIKKAVIWLSKKTGKPVLKLTEEDYKANGMAQLVTSMGPVYNLNINVFNKLQHTITGWPGGKPDADDSQRPERALPAVKKSILFSPQPDDDVISMGGTFIRLADQGHDIHVAYQTSGNSAVWDDEALRFVEFSIDFCRSQQMDTAPLESLHQEMRSFFNTKQPNQADQKPIQTIKGLIRKREAMAGARFAGLADDHIHFMALPFYEKNKGLSENNYEDDIEQTMELLNKVMPQQVFAAGDFADPHGTHKICFDILLEALVRLKKTEAWVKDCWLWLYRGAWHEFEMHEIEMAVPLSPQEVKRKRYAIFKHQSQKDVPVFPGDDAREFWVRAEDRTRETARNYDRLGLAEYEAVEAFARWKF
ncbi:MAG: glucosamine-6-phosphate deaminase [Gloeobacteraceae cyanobacterium ES-bin-316]|nr:glucosamine-6-phosphate deaminase [Ferruginibacter sp.]